MVSALTGNLNAIFGIALALGNNAPVRTCNVHDNRKIGLLRQLCHNILGSLAATFFFTVGVINNFLEIIKACSLQGFQAIDNLYYGSLVIAYTRSPGKIILVNTERTTCSFTLFKYCINMGNKQNRVFACSL